MITASFRRLCSLPRAVLSTVSSIVLPVVIIFVALCASMVMLVANCIQGRFPFSFNTFKVLAFQFFESLRSGYHPDVKRTAPEIIRSKAFPVEEHKCATRDGHVLELHRIPHGRVGKVHARGRGHTHVTHVAGDAHHHAYTHTHTHAQDPLGLGSDRRVVLVQHGLWQSSAVYLMNDAHECFPYVLADAGHDVWVGNNRGTSYSKFKAGPSAHWDWSLADMGEHDCEAMVEYILRATGEKSLVYIGHSQGSGQMFAALCTSPTLNSKISLFVAMSPAVFVSDADRGILKGLSFLAAHHPEAFVSSFGSGELMPIVQPLRALARSAGTAVWAIMGLLMFHILLGWNDRDLNPHRLAVLFSHTPDRTSTSTLLHLLQLMRSRKFRPMDRGLTTNRRRHGTDEPPEYDLKRVTCPVAVLYGARDGIIDVPRLLERIDPVLVQVQPEYNHMEYLWGVNAHKEVYPTILQLISKYGSTATAGASPSPVLVAA
eukprot:Opistho-2@36712